MFLFCRECSFLSKAVQAERAGAVAIIISDYDVSSDGLFIEMIDDKTVRQSHIPAAFLVGKNGLVIDNYILCLELWRIGKFKLNRTW